MAPEPTPEEKWYQMLTEGEPVTSIICWGCCLQAPVAKCALHLSRAGAERSCTSLAGTNPNIIPASAQYAINSTFQAALKWN